MDNLEYLNQISKSTRPAPPNKFALILKNPITRFVFLGAIVAVIIVIVINVISAISNRTTNLSREIYLRSSTLNSIVSENKSLIKSSQLRAISVSLQNVISNSSREFVAYYTSPDGGNSLSPTQDQVNAENANAQQVRLTLQNARLNGILDRIYTNELNLQIRLLMSMISELVARTSDERLKTVGTNYYNNLLPIQSSLESYSSAAS